MAALAIEVPSIFSADEAAAPLIAAFSEPWPGGASVYSSAAGQGWRMDRVLAKPATLGELISTLPGAAPH
jgi:hypothetical protein